MDDERLKGQGGGDYWKELLDRIRDIRSSEKALYRQVLDLYATSQDYDSTSEATISFFKMVQNKLHYAASLQTAPELIFNRAKSGLDLINVLNQNQPWLFCSLIHKFASSYQSDASDDDLSSTNTSDFLSELQNALFSDFSPKGKIFVFIDECHRTQSGLLHKAMKSIIPNAVFVGFTGTPLMKKDKKKSIEVFGSYIHTYKFDQAVQDGVVLDLRYEALDIDQYVKNPKRVDEWFELKTKGLSNIAKTELKKRWGTMQAVLSSRSRQSEIVSDILMDMERKPRLASGSGNAMLVCSSVYQACTIYELFSRTELSGKVAIVTSYTPHASSIKGEETGEGETEQLFKYHTYRKMIADYYGETKSYGYIIDYKDLFQSIDKAVTDYTQGALDGLDALDHLPENLRDNDSVAETMENNIKRTIVEQNPINPKYYEQMSVLLEELIEHRRKGAIEYKKYLEKIFELAKKTKKPSFNQSTYPDTLKTLAQQVLYDNLDRNEELAIQLDMAILDNLESGWQGNKFKERLVINTIHETLP